jgi:hypothetical protein
VQGKTNQGLIQFRPSPSDFAQNRYLIAEGGGAEAAGKIWHGLVGVGVALEGRSLQKALAAVLKVADKLPGALVAVHVVPE